MSKHRTTKKGNKGIKIPKPNIPKVSTKEFPIPQEELNHLKKLKDKRMVFSFRFIELQHEAFNLTGTCYKWSNDLFKLLKELSEISRNYFVNELLSRYRCHIHIWEHLKYKYDFDDDFLEQVECRQARISISKGGIHGFIIGNRFYVVWLDPQHNLYPDVRHGGLKLLEPPETCCGYRDKKLSEMEEQIKKYKSKLEEYHELLDESTAPDCP